MSIHTHTNDTVTMLWKHARCDSVCLQCDFTRVKEVIVVSKLRSDATNCETNVRTDNVLFRIRVCVDVPLR